MTAYKDFRFFLNATEDQIHAYLHKIDFFWAKICTECNTVTHLSAEGGHWICCRTFNNSVCRTRISIYKQTIFEFMKISVKDFFYILNEWRKNVMAEIVAIDLDVAITTVQKWYNKISEIFVWKVKSEMPIAIGGVNTIVEFDETLLVRRKYNRGRILQGQKWVVVGAERGNKKNYFVESVAHRSRACLLPVIMRRILPGSVIMTDDWGAYKRLMRDTRDCYRGILLLYIKGILLIQQQVRTRRL